MAIQWGDIGTEGRLFESIDNRIHTPKKGVKVYEGLFQAISGICALIVGRAGWVYDDVEKKVVLYNVKSMAKFLEGNLGLKDATQRRYAANRKVSDNMVKQLVASISGARRSERYIEALVDEDEPEENTQQSKSKQIKVKTSDVQQPNDPKDATKKYKVVTKDGGRQYLVENKEEGKEYEIRRGGAVAASSSFSGLTYQIAQMFYDAVLEEKKERVALPFLFEGQMLPLSTFQVQQLTGLLTDAGVNVQLRIADDDKSLLIGDLRIGLDKHGIFFVPKNLLLNTCVAAARGEKIAEQHINKQQDQNIKEFFIRMNKSIDVLKMYGQQTAGILNELQRKLEEQNQAQQGRVVTEITLRETVEKEPSVDIEETETGFVVGDDGERQEKHTDVIQIRMDTVTAGELARDLLNSGVGLVGMALQQWVSEHTKSLKIDSDNIHIQVRSTALREALYQCGVTERVLYDSVIRDNDAESVILTNAQISVLRDYIQGLPAQRTEDVDLLPQAPQEVADAYLEWLADIDEAEQGEKNSALPREVVKYFLGQPLHDTIIVARDDLLVACQSVGLDNFNKFIEFLSGQESSTLLKITPEVMERLQESVQGLLAEYSLVRVPASADEKLRIANQAWRECELDEKMKDIRAPSGEEVGEPKNQYSSWVSSRGLMTDALMEKLNSIQGDRIFLPDSFKQAMRAYIEKMRGEGCGGVLIGKCSVIFHEVIDQKAKSIKKEDDVVALLSINSEEVSRSCRVSSLVLRNALCRLNMLTQELDEKISREKECVLDEKVITALRQWRENLETRGVGGRVLGAQEDFQEVPRASVAKDFVTDVERLKETVYAGAAKGIVLGKNIEDFTDDDIYMLCAFMKGFGSATARKKSYAARCVVGAFVAIKKGAEEEDGEKKEKCREIKEKIRKCADALNREGKKGVSRVLKAYWRE